MKCVLLTGGTGFVGRHLTAAFIANGWRVVAVVRQNSDTSALSGVETVVHEGTTESMIRLVAEARPQLCVHLASLFVAEHGIHQIVPLVESNVLFGVQLLEGMLHAGVRHLINTGTPWQHYGDASYDPVCLYAATKQAFEDLLAYYVQAHGFKACTLELFDIYGPGDDRPKLFNLLRWLAGNGERLSMSPGEQLIDLVHIDDVVSAYLCAASLVLAENREMHSRYVVSSGQSTLLREVVGAYARIKGVSLAIDWGGRPYRLREMMTPWSGGRPLPGWAPRITLEEGLRGLP